GPSPAKTREGASDGYWLNLLDQFHLRAIGALDPADVPAVVEQLFKDAGAVALQFGERAGVVVGLDRDVLDPDMLLVLLRLDDRRDVELQPGEVELAAAPGDLPLHRRAEIVDVEFRDLLGITLGLDVDVSDVHRHARLLR